MNISYPRVVGIVVEYKSGPLIDRCLESLLNQSVKFHKIVVVNNDVETPFVRSDFHEILVINSPLNCGFGAAVNFAVAREATEADFIATFNPDTVLDSKWLETCLSAASCFPKAASFATDMTQMDGKLWDGRGDKLYPGLIARRKGYGRAIRTVGDSEYPPTEVVDSVCAAAALYRKKDFIQLAGFWQELFLYLEDVELGLRFRRSGRTNIQIHAALAKHVGSGTTGGRCGRDPVFYSERNRILILLGSLSGSQFIIGVLTKPFGDLILLVRAIYCRRLGAYLAGTLAGWSNIEMANRKRAENNELIAAAFNPT